MRFVTWPTIIDFITLWCCINLNGAWWTTAFAVSSEAVFQRAQLHRFGTWKAQSEDFEACLKWWVVKVLPSIRDTCTGVDCRVTPWWRRYGETVYESSLVNSCYRQYRWYFYVSIPHYRLCKKLKSHSAALKIKRKWLSIIVISATVIVCKCHENTRNIENENELAKVMIQYERTADLDYHNNKLFSLISSSSLWKTRYSTHSYCERTSQKKVNEWLCNQFTTFVERRDKILKSFACERHACVPQSINFSTI